MPEKQPSQMARAYTQQIRKAFDAIALKTALLDQPQRASDGGRGSEPCGRARRAFRTAAQTGAIARLSRGGGRRKISAIFLHGGRCRADRTAIDPAPMHADEEFAIEPRIARQPRPRTDVPVEFGFLHVTENTRSSPI